MLSSKEIALKALKRQKNGYTPVGIFLGGIWPVLNSGLTLEGLIGDYKQTARVFYETNERLDGDIIMVGAGATALIIRALGGHVRFDKRGAPQIIGELIKIQEDLDGLNITSALKDSSIQWIKDVSKEVARLAQDKRLILISGRAPFTLAAQLYGLENFSRAIYKDTAFAHKILEFTTELATAYFKLLIEEGNADGVFIADPSASGDVISKKHFGQFSAPYLKRVADSLKVYKKPIMLHICGDITDRLELIPPTGIDSLSLDTKVDLQKAFEIIGDKVSIAGNVDPVNILEFGSREDVRKGTMDCLQKGAENGGFILLPGCDLAGGVPEENIKIFVDTAHKYTLKTT